MKGAAFSVYTDHQGVYAAQAEGLLQGFRSRKGQ